MSGLSSLNIPETAKSFMRRDMHGHLLGGTGRDACRSDREAAPPQRWMAVGIPSLMALCSAMDLR